MKLEIARLLSNKEHLLSYLAKENIVPVKAPPWAAHRFELRRNEKMLKGLIGRHVTGRKTMPLILDALGVHDEKSCKEVREHIKHLRKIYGYG
jgi:hypothetical protein